jgi:hypothetical protein
MNPVNKILGNPTAPTNKVILKKKIATKLFIASAIIINGPIPELKLLKLIPFIFSLSLLLV